MLVPVDVGQATGQLRSCKVWRVLLCTLCALARFNENGINVQLIESCRVIWTFLKLAASKAYDGVAGSSPPRGSLSGDTAPALAESGHAAYLKYL